MNIVNCYDINWQGNWNYFAALRSSEKKGPKLEATHLEKAKELYTKVSSVVRFLFYQVLLLIFFLFAGFEGA